MDFHGGLDALVHLLLAAAAVHPVRLVRAVAMALDVAAGAGGAGGRGLVAADAAQAAGPAAGGFGAAHDDDGDGEMRVFGELGDWLKVGTRSRLLAAKSRLRRRWCVRHQQRNKVLTGTGRRVQRSVDPGMQGRMDPIGGGSQVIGGRKRWHEAARGQVRSSEGFFRSRLEIPAEEP